MGAIKVLREVESVWALETGASGSELCSDSSVGTARFYLLSCKLGAITDPSQTAAGKTGGLIPVKGLAPCLERAPACSVQAVTIPSSTAVLVTSTVE